MADVPRKPRDAECSEYVIENYKVDFRDEAHKKNRINYFDTIFFHKGWLFNQMKAQAIFANYEKSLICMTNEYWVPMDFIIQHGRGLIEEKIKLGKIQSKGNRIRLGDDHHFYFKNYRDIENNVSIRLDDVQLDDEVLEIKARRVTYFDQAATNLAAYGQELVGDVDIRRYDAEMNGDGWLPKSLKESNLANSLGVACIFEVRDHGKPVLVPRYRPERRSKAGHVHAVMSDGAWHCSSSGVVEYIDLDLNLGVGESKCIPLKSIETAIVREIETESRLYLEDDYDLVPLCFSREIPRAGKPQFFYKAVIREDKFDNLPKFISHLQKSFKPEGWEYDDAKLSSPEFEKMLRYLRGSGLVDIADKFTYEGFANIQFGR